MAMTTAARIEIAAHRRGGGRQLPGDLPVYARFLRQCTAKHHDRARELEDTLPQIGRML
jgi:hypothetical protein